MNLYEQYAEEISLIKVKYPDVKLTGSCMIYHIGEKDEKYGNQRMWTNNLFYRGENSYGRFYEVWSSIVFTEKRIFVRYKSQSSGWETTLDCYRRYETDKNPTREIDISSIEELQDYLDNPESKKWNPGGL